MLQDERKRFLTYFEPAKRSTIANTFLDPIRDQIRKGITDPDLVITEVYEKARRNSDKKYISDIIFKYLHDAFEYVSFLFDWEKLPSHEKTYYKSQQARKAIHFHMAQEAPTEKQINYLKVLGYKGKPPVSKAEASDLIATIKTFQKLQ